MFIALHIVIESRCNDGRTACDVCVTCTTGSTHTVNECRAPVRVPVC